MVEELYDIRFNEAEQKQKEKIWQVLCKSFFQKYVRRDSTVLEVACGFGEFITNIDCQHKIAVDINTSVKERLPSNIDFRVCSATDMEFVEDNSVDTVFVSNFFEHLPNKDVLSQVLESMHRVLKPGGQLIMMQPNFKFSYDAYWDFYDHHLPLSHLTMAEGVQMAGFKLGRVIPKFMPFSTKSKIPKHPFLVRLYLAFPPAWKIMGKQFFLQAIKEGN